jgi:hypothetical protein
MKDQLFEMLIPRRPLSVQANKQNLQNWKNYIYGRARDEWKHGTPYAKLGLRLTLANKRKPRTLSVYKDE